MGKITRRSMLRLSSQYAGLVGAGLPLLGQRRECKSQRRLKVIVAGGHPGRSRIRLWRDHRALRRISAMKS